MTNKDHIINPEKVISHVLNELRITDSKIIKDTSLIVKNFDTSNIDEFWINVIRAIVAVCDDNQYTFSKSELCDFLTIGARGMNKKNEAVTSTDQLINKVVGDALFNIYKDIMENYDNIDSDLKYYYPKIILNIISIIQRGSDINGEKINIYGLERHYLMYKHNFINEKSLISEPTVSIIGKNDNIDRKKVNEVTTSLPTLESVFVKRNTSISKKDLVNNLSVITGKKKNELNDLLMKISEQDYKKIADLCINYSKLQKYSKLIGTKKFSYQIEKELGRKLSDRQLQHATISIRKVKIYVENVLDGKFVPHGSHGINHVKHNLEYGYQLMGLIEYRRRKYILFNK